MLLTRRPVRAPMAVRERRVLGVLAVVLTGLALAAYALEWAVAAGFATAGPNTDRFVAMAGLLLAAAVVAWVLWGFFRTVGARLRRREGARALHALGALETVAAFVVAVVVVVVAGASFGTAVVGLGLIGFGLTLALQRPILSMAGWAAIRFGGLFREGDRIEIHGIVGDVLYVGLFKTRLWEIGSAESPLPWGGTISPLRETGRTVTLTNAIFLEEPVANATNDVPFVFDEFVVTVAYEADWKLGERILRDVAGGVLDPAAHERAAREYGRLARGMTTKAEFPREPQVLIQLEDSWIELRLRYLVDVRKRSIVRTRLARGWQEASAEHPEELPNVYRRTQPMQVGRAGRGLQ